MRVIYNIPKDLERLFLNRNPEDVISEALRGNQNIAQDLSVIRNMCLEILLKEPEVVANVQTPKLVASAPIPLKALPISTVSDSDYSDDDDDDDLMNLFVK